MKKGRRGRLSDHAGRNASERRAGLETNAAEADPPIIRGRLPAVGKRATQARGLNWDSVDLMYMDPPFNSNRNYEAPIGSAPAGTPFRDTWTLSDVNEAWHGEIAEQAPEVYAALDNAGTSRGEIHHRTDIPRRADLGKLPNCRSSRSQCHVSCRRWPERPTSRPSWKPHRRRPYDSRPNSRPRTNPRGAVRWGARGPASR